MYQVKVNDKYNFDLSVDDKSLKVNDKLVELNTVLLTANTNSILFNNKSYNVELVELNKTEKTAIIKVNNNIYGVNIKDQFDQLLKQLGMDNLTANKIQHIKAPMPGLVLNVLVQEGVEVKKGDNLLVLEAMKMENMLKSPTDGVVRKIEVKQGDKVEKNQVLIKFD